MHINQSDVNQVDNSYRQVGALPYRVLSSGEGEILLVTSRGTRQWIVPKGWPMDGLSDSQAAAQEAYEEAGVIGPIDTVPIGHFTYEKQAKGNDHLSAFWVDVYLMRVERQLAFWPEASQRTLAWMSPQQAADLVTNPTLRMLIEELPEHLGAS